MSEPARVCRRVQPAHRLPASLHPVVQRVLAARGVTDPQDLPLDLNQLLRPESMLGLARAAELVVDAIARQQRIVIAGDYDCDGATGVALGVLGLRLLGAKDPGYVVPNRFTMGYGLSPPLAAQARAQGAELLITVDNGIASLAGVQAARELGMRVIVTDHHLPGPELPQADALVNPRLPGCGFASKHLAGVGVMFYLLLAVRARLRQAGLPGGEARLADLLDLVAVGTVADLVLLDRNNRVLVAQGLARLRAGRGNLGLRALIEVAGRRTAELGSVDLGFVLGPRLNAAGRLEDIRIGIECLLCEDASRALELARELDRLNRERRVMQGEMSAVALDLLAQIDAGERHGLALFDPEWHEGVVGLVASRIKDHAHRPTVAFAPAQEAGVLKGSARSIAGLHLRDVLADVDALHPGLILRFGGHAMAAGLSLEAAHFERFSLAFDQACAARLSPAQLERRVETDGALSGTELNLETARALHEAGPWGQGMPEALFDDRFEVIEARLVGADQSHVRYRLRGPGGATLVAVHFGGAAQVCLQGAIHAVFALAVNRWQDRESLELRLVQVQPG